MTFNKTTILGFLFSSAFAIPAFATDSIHAECKTCESDYQFYSAAKNNTILNKALFVNIVNFENYELRKYKASKSSYRECEYDQEPDDRGGRTEICRTRYNYSVTSATPTTKELNEFDDLATKVNDAREYYSARSIEIPATVVDSGYKVIGAGYIETKIIDYFNRMPLRNNIIERAAAVTNAVTSMASVGFKFEMPPLVFTFSDGVKAYVTFDFYDMDDQVHFKFIKLFDANGNIFDLGKANPFANKIYNFEGMTAGSWATLYNAMNAYGLGVRGASESIIPTGTVTVITCSSGKDDLCKSTN